MKIPFSVDEFLQVFERYNNSVFPAHIIAYLLGVIAVVLVFNQRKNAGKIISAILALYWLWMGSVYHIVFFSAINKAAFIFGIVFIIQAILFLIAGAFKNKLHYSLNLSAIKINDIAAIAFIIYGMLVYPILNVICGHPYPTSPVFGLSPCPTVMFTFGMLLLVKDKVPFGLLLIPFLWSLVGFSAAVSLGMAEDYGLAVAGVAGLMLILINNKKLMATKV